MAIILKCSLWKDWRNQLPLENQMDSTLDFRHAKDRCLDKAEKNYKGPSKLEKEMN